MLKLPSKSLFIVFLVLFLITPSFASAKNQNIHPGKYARVEERATHSTASLNLEEDVSQANNILTEIGISSDKKIETEVDLYPTIAIIRIEPARPFYIFPRAKSASITISKLKPGATYYLYKEKLSNPIILEANESGEYSLDLDTPRHRYLILKTTPSTYHIDATSSGGDCSTIGTWNFSTKTCTLSPTATINQIIEIDDGGITLDGGGRVISHADDIGIYANRDPIFDDSMADIIIKNLTLDVPTMGITLIDLPNGFVRNTTVKNAVTGVSLKDDLNIEITQNNLLSNTTDLSLENTGGTILSTSIRRGNFWSKFSSCTQDPANPNQCTNSFNGDSKPWACQNAWLTGITCPFTPPIGGGGGEPGSWGEINSLSGTANFYSDSALTTIVKTLPDGWALEVLETNSSFIRAQDHTNGDVGFIKNSELIIAEVDSAQESDLINRSTIRDTEAERIPMILEAVNLYHESSSGDKTLFNSAGGLDGSNNFLTYTNDLNFPKELRLAIIAEESGGDQFNNNKCSYAADGGIGISQITTPFYKGRGSGFRNNAHVSDCVGSSGEGAYYSNSKQGIYANIKDGFRVFQNKYQEVSAFAKINNSATTTWWTGHTYSVNKRDLKLLTLVRAYNGYGQRCQPFLTDPRYKDYQARVANRLENLSQYFGLDYANSDNLIEKLRDSSGEHIDISICSPAFLLITNAQGQRTGFSSVLYDEIPEVDFDYFEKKGAAILFPQGNYIYTVTGSESGTYTFYANHVSGGAELLFEANNIPTDQNSVHQYNVNWQHKTAVVKIDQEGDGTFERELKTGLSLTAEEFSSTKITICHTPPGNISNPQTISISSNAWKAHEKHGDHLGSCSQINTTKPTKKNRHE
ncbi:MAG TPA: hypothetical protein VJJ24_03600 [Candidatus Paceibacterota bacterium]